LNEKCRSGGSGLLEECVLMFVFTVPVQGARRERRDMSGQESDPAALFRLYVDYGRYPEATELLLEYIEAYASVVSYLLE